MKKQFSIYSNLMLLLFFGLLVACSEKEIISINDDSAYVQIPDANFERKLIELGVDSDGELNQRISRKDAMETDLLILYTSIGAEEQDKIKDLIGIEAFKNLKHLSLFNNALTEISLEENDQLESLNLELNRLQELDISSNTNLIDLNVAFNELVEVRGFAEAQKLNQVNLSWNYLESLSLPLPALENLNVEHNLLRELNLNGSQELAILIARVNELETINLDNNVKIKYVTLSDNQLKQLDLKNNLLLEKLWLHRNQLNHLDVAMLDQLNLLGILQNDDLDCVQISDGQIIWNINKEEYQNLSVGECP